MFLKKIVRFQNSKILHPLNFNWSWKSNNLLISSTKKSIFYHSFHYIVLIIISLTNSTKTKDELFTQKNVKSLFFEHQRWNFFLFPIISHSIFILERHPTYNISHKHKWYVMKWRRKQNISISYFWSVNITGIGSVGRFFIIRNKCYCAKAERKEKESS